MKAYNTDFNKTIEFLATASTIIGYLLVTQQILVTGILISIIGSLCWIGWGYLQIVNTKGLYVVNSFLIGCGILGLVA